MGQGDRGRIGFMMVVVAVCGQGITLLDIAAIEAVEFEHEVAASGE